MINEFWLPFMCIKVLLMVLVKWLFAIKQNSNMMRSGEAARRHLDWKDASFVDSVG